MLAGTIVTLVTIPIYWTLHQHFNVIGLAWASDIAIVLHTVTLATLLHRRKMVPLFGPSGGLDRPEILRAAAAGIISFAGTWLLLHLIPQRQTYLGDIISLTLGGTVWATLAVATLHLTGSKLLTQLRQRLS
jgi:putative peptidoglycan lipid II flippase